MIQRKQNPLSLLSFLSGRKYEQHCILLLDSPLLPYFLCSPMTWQSCRYPHYLILKLFALMELQLLNKMNLLDERK